MLYFHNAGVPVYTHHANVLKLSLFINFFITFELFNWYWRDNNEHMGFIVVNKLH